MNKFLTAALLASSLSCIAISASAQGVFGDPFVVIQSSGMSGISASTSSASHPVMIVSTGTSQATGTGN